MHTQDIEYSADGVRMIGQYVVDDGKPGRRAGVLVCHEGPGLTDHTKKIAARLAGLGYAAFAMDYHGDGKPLADRTQTMARLAPWMADPTGIRTRALAALDVLKSQKEVDPAKLAAIGYCFGGTTALEIGRSGADVKAIVGFHSGLATARPQDAKNIKGKVLVCIGADDPIIPPAQRAGFENEMTAAGIDWRLQLYGGAGHSFTNPAADSRGMKGFFFHEATDRRSWNAMIELFNETLN
ncbi:dienelactone hydrolase family protein [Reyranella sp.]|uniref:dienelactone hydrolase family protein n=1 Tax=Reyranella sp. TaxID=1929291 RepID=UPI0011F7122F|nr:dienelactone hydrolase family protein [Reyranella sp.]TAJ83346.1 MAG: dienelactone hydrolase family protein [Reyranella sp.]